LSARLAELTTRLQLSDDEALAIFHLDALEAIGGDTGHRPEIEIVDTLTSEAAALAGDDSLARWLRSTATSPTPFELLEQGDFAAFEDALDAWLRSTGVLDSP
jgi:hypothetical protein